MPDTTSMPKSPGRRGMSPPKVTWLRSTGLAALARDAAGFFAGAASPAGVAGAAGAAGVSMAITSGSSRFSTIRPVWPKMRALALAYAGRSPCQSRWSWLMLSTVAAVGSKPTASSSWKLESSSTQVSGSVPASMCWARVSSSVGPMLPATATLRPAQSASRPVSEVTVVLPLVPVMASTAGA